MIDGQALDPGKTRNDRRGPGRSKMGSAEREGYTRIHASSSRWIDLNDDMYREGEPLLCTLRVRPCLIDSDERDVMNEIENITRTGDCVPIPSGGLDVRPRSTVLMEGSETWKRSASPLFPPSRSHCRTSVSCGLLDRVKAGGTKACKGGGGGDVSAIPSNSNDARVGRDG